MRKFADELFSIVQGQQDPAFLLQAHHAASATAMSSGDLKAAHGFPETFLIDTDNFTNGGLNASKDQVTNTSALDFSYGTVYPTNPDELILIQGAGTIPNSAFTITSTTAHLGPVTVSNSDSFLIIRCVINQVAGTFECAPTTPKSFDLT
jgi:hypothetical protein